jgi:hypothetical protein
MFVAVLHRSCLIFLLIFSIRHISEGTYQQDIQICLIEKINKQIKQLLWRTATNISEGKYQQDIQTCLIEKIQFSIGAV